MGSSLFLNGGTVLAKTVSETIVQSLHGFVHGDVIRYNASQGKFIRAQANNAENSEVAGVVSTVNDADSFTMVYSGLIELNGFDGISHPALFLSDTTAGGMTFSPPSVIGSVVKPVAIRSNSKKGHLVVNYLGTQIGGSSTVAIDQIQPVGTISPYAGSATPDTWLECNGLSYAVSDYSELYDRLLYESAPRAPLYGHVTGIGGSGFSSLAVGDIIQYKTSSGNWSGNAAASNADLVAVVISIASNTSMTVQVVPKYSTTDKNFTISNTVLLNGSSVSSETGTGNYRVYTLSGTFKSVSFTASSFAITHFNTPDLRGRFALGRNTAPAGEIEVPNDSTYSSTIAGNYTLASEGGQESTIAGTGVASGTNAYVTSTSISGGFVSNMPPYLAVRYIIKAKPYTRAAIISGVDPDYPNLLVTDLRSGLQRGVDGVGSDLVFKTNTAAFTSGTERMRLSNAGSLGIGTQSPTKRLHLDINTNNSAVTDLMNIDGMVLRNSNTESASGNKISLRFDTFNSGSAGTPFGSQIGLCALMSALDSNDLWVFSEYFGNPAVNTATTPIMCFKGNDGRIGIGTGSPAAPLHLNRPQCELRLTDTAVSGADWGILAQTDNNRKLFRIIDRNTGSGALADRLCIDSSGLIGMGTINPVSALTVDAGNNIATFRIGVANNLSVGRSGVDCCGIGYNLAFTSTANSWTYRGSDKSSLMRFHNGGFDFWGTSTSGSANSAVSLAKLMVVDPVGVGIGVDSDLTYRLKVAGKIYASDDIVAFSDARYKRDISPIVDSLSKVRSLVGVLYTDANNARKTGLLAQDVQAVLPEAVTVDENGTLSLAYGNLAGILVQAIKELAVRVDELEKR
jgi:hypothetical protein